MRMFTFVSLIFLFCNPSSSMETQVPQSPHDNQENDIIYINIGGHLIVTTKNTINLSGMSYFKSLFNGKFGKMNYDKKGNIFIDRDQEEARFIESFIRTHTLPSKCNLELAQRVAEYFGSDEIKNLIKSKKEKKKKMSGQKIMRYWEDVYTECPECERDFDEEYPAFKIIRHLIKKHKAEICNWSFQQTSDDSDPYIIILYRLPQH
jgi:BTB/POZ domain